MTDVNPPIDGDGDGTGTTFGSIEPIEIQEEMERSFLEYSMSVIVSRALPDVRDGLKPVHRRILWNMFDQGFRPDRSHVKCARVSGDVMAKLHPHGEGAIYDALVRLAQPFSLRDPLIDFHGNYGSPEFPPAAQRYTECRLSPLAMRMLDGIDEETVDFGDNYSGEFREPLVLPARFPNLLVNGSQGIAVGMATNIPPHNLGEVIDAAVHLLHNPESTADDLMRFVKGPDFPTGGLILGRQGIMDAYRTGRGSVRIRARAEIEETRSGPEIVVSELPYQTSGGAIASRIADLHQARELDGIRSIEDHSSGDTVRLVIGLKRDANANVVLNNLYKHTPMQTSFPVNMVALCDGVPRTLNLVQVLQGWIDHQVEVITRRSEFRLSKARDRAHIVEGLIKAIDVIDPIIALIRASEDRAAARSGLMAEPFQFSEVQATYILDLQLGRLTRLGRVELEEELATLRETITELERILGDEAVLRGVIQDELADIRAKFATPRVAEITHDPGDLIDLDLLEDKELVVTMTRAMYLKAVDAAAFRTQARGGRGVRGGALREEDLVTHVIHTTAHAYLLFFSNTGRVYRLRAHEIPERERAARGMPIVNLLSLGPDERIQAVIDTRDYETNRYLLFVTKQGQVKKTLMSEYDKSRREGFIAISLRDGDELVRVIQTNGTEDVILASRLGMAIRFSNDDEQVRPMGRDAAGVRGMKLRDGDEVVSADIADDAQVLLMVTENGWGKRTRVSEYPAQNRGGLGLKSIRLVNRRGNVVAAYVVDRADAEVMIASSGGVVIRVRAGDIGHQPLGRDAMGVRIMALDEDHVVASVAPILLTPED